MKQISIPVRVLLSIVLIAIIIGSWTLASSLDFKSMQDQGRQQEQINNRIAQVMGVWGGIKIASAVISFIQTIQIEGSIPVVGGLAVSAQPLGWADVVNNTLDKISNILLWAAGALVIQKLLLAISIWVSLGILIPLCALIIIAVIWNKRYSGQLIKVVAGIVIITAGICGAVPLSLELSNIIESSILYSYINETVSGIDDTANELESSGDQANDIGWLRRLGTGIVNFFDSIVDHFWNIINRTINYIMCFIVVNILIPIGTLFFLKYMVSSTLKYIGFSIHYNNFIPAGKRKQLAQ